MKFSRIHDRVPFSGWTNDVTGVNEPQFSHFDRREVTAGSQALPVEQTVSWKINAHFLRWCTNCPSQRIISGDCTVDRAIALRKMIW